jgi:hypothetical protein
MLDMLPDSGVGVIGWTEGFEGAGGEDGGALEAHDFSEAVDEDAAVEGMGEEVWVDEWWFAGVGGLEGNCAFGLGVHV